MAQNIFFTKLIYFLGQMHFAEFFGEETFEFHDGEDGVGLADGHIQGAEEVIFWHGFTEGFDDGFFFRTAFGIF